MLKLEKPGCTNCPSACCRDFILTLNEDEADLVAFGRFDSEEDPIDRRRDPVITKLTFLGKPSSGRDLRGYYRMDGECGWLEKAIAPGARMRKCKLHETGDQPLVCGSGFPQGTYGCLKRREAVLRPPSDPARVSEEE